MGTGGEDELWSQLYGEAAPEAAAVEAAYVTQPWAQPDLGYDLSLSATPAAAPQYDQAAPTQAQQQAQAVQQQQQQQGSHAGAHAQQAALQGQQYMPQQANQNGMYGAYGGSMDPADDLDLIVDSGAPYASTFVAGAGAQGQGSVADDDALDLLLPAEPRATPLVSAAAGPAAAQAPAAKSAAPATVAEVAARARSKAQEQQARAPINGLVVPPPPLQRGLAMLDPSQVQAAMPVIDWNLPPAFPSEAAPAQPIKLPRHSKVMQAEYKEFLALGHGDIFGLEVLKAVALDRYGNPQQPPWMVPGADLSDFFNYGLDLDSWRYYCAAIAAYKKQYCLLAHPRDSTNFPIIDEDDHELPYAQQGGIAHRIPAFNPGKDDRPHREPIRRRPAESASVTVTLVNCDWQELAREEVWQSAPPDVVNPRLVTPLGIRGITDFPHYHFDPEADERHKEAKLSMYGAAMSALDGGLGSVTGGAAEDKGGGMMGEDLMSGTAPEAAPLQIGYEQLVQTLEEGTMGGGMMDDEPMGMHGGEDLMSGNVQPKEEPVQLDLRTGLPAAPERDLRRGGGSQMDGSSGFVHSLRDGDKSSGLVQASAAAFDDGMGAAWDGGMTDTDVGMGGGAGLGSGGMGAGMGGMGAAPSRDLREDLRGRGSRSIPFRGVSARGGVGGGVGGVRGGMRGDSGGAGSVHVGDKRPRGSDSDLRDRAAFGTRRGADGERERRADDRSAAHGGRGGLQRRRGDEDVDFVRDDERFAASDGDDGDAKGGGRERRGARRRGDDVRRGERARSRETSPRRSRERALREETSGDLREQLRRRRG